MKRFIKKLIKNIIQMITTSISATKIGSFVNEIIINDVMSRVKEVSHDGLILKFAIPNALNRYRAETFSTKEPETLEWIDRFPDDAVLWDIGANVGLYTIYAAKKGLRVFSFEPSVFNLEILARNIFLNEVVKHVTIIPLPLSDKSVESNLKMTTTVWGGALSTFDKEYGHDGETIKEVFEFPTLGISMVEAVELLKIRRPDYIKMDVDGIEHIILAGGLPVLKSVKSILIEINDNFNTQAKEAKSTLEEAGFSLKEKRHADFFDHDGSAAEYTFNQIWVNSNAD
jgi:FkbM family methyltransferase